MFQEAFKTPKSGSLLYVHTQNWSLEKACYDVLGLEPPHGALSAVEIECFQGESGTRNRERQHTPHRLCPVGFFFFLNLCIL